MHERIRNAAAIGVVGLCLALAIPTLLQPQPSFTGITLRFDGSSLVVASVDPSRAYTGLQPGTIVHDVNYAVVSDIPEKQMDALLAGDFVELGVPDPAGGWTQFTFTSQAGAPSAFVFVLGLGMFLGIAAWVARGLGGETLRRLALPIAAASAAPLILLSIPSVLPAPLVFAAAALPPGAQLVLADGLVERVARGTWRRAAAFVAVAASIGYLAVQWAFFGPSSAVRVGPPDVAAILAVMLIASIALVPAAILVVSGNRARVLSGVPHVGRGDWLPIALAALTPTVISIGYVALGLGVDLPLMWLLIVVIVLQANARVETLRTQRDTVVAATEAERARLAADLHDDALQEMTVLVRRLDQTGDVRAAAVARSIADSLREVCGELRLPILDELGAGPALEWLVERVGHASGHRVTLERVDAGRPPSDVELAVFRVAQEALANAVTHGAPPVVVRYEATPDRALLSIIDHGRGIAADAATLAGRSGHYGLLNMRQRADQIGARFDVRRPPNGGTVIGLTWARA